MTTLPPEHRASVVVLVSGSGTLLQAVLEAAADPAYGVRVAAVGADRDGIEGLARAERAGVPTFVVRLEDHPDRLAWDRALAEAIGSHHPDVVVSAGFMKIIGEPSLRRFRIVNTHPTLLPSFPGAHGVRDALAHGVKVTGATLFEVDPGVDTGRILAQRAVEVLPDDTEERLHERIKVVERAMLVEELPRLLRADLPPAGHG